MSSLCRQFIYVRLSDSNRYDEIVLEENILVRHLLLVRFVNDEKISVCARVARYANRFSRFVISMQWMQTRTQ
jgi:hypothetical protein